MQNLLRSRLVPSLLGIAAVKIHNDQTENKVWGAASFRTEDKSIKSVCIKAIDLYEMHGAIIDSNGTLIQFKLPYVPMGPTCTSDDLIKSKKITEYPTIVGHNLIDVACSKYLVHSLDANGSIYKTYIGQTETPKSFLSLWGYTMNIGKIPCVGLRWGEKIVQIESGDKFMIARSNKG